MLRIVKWVPSVFYCSLKKLIFFVSIVIIVTIFCTTAPLQSSSRIKTLIIQSMSIEPYNLAISGFNKVFSSKHKRIVLSEQKKINLRRVIKRERPDLIYTVGINALYSIKNANHNIPVVSSMIPKNELQAVLNKNITGVSMEHSTETLISIICNVLPETKYIYILYSPEYMGPIFEEIRTIGKNKNIDVLGRAIYSPKDVLATLKNIRGDIKNSVYLMLPDTGVINKVNIEAILLHSLENRIPIVTFSKKYLKLGAFMSISFDPYDIGMQAGEIAFAINEKITEGKKLGMLGQSPADARKAIITVNKTIIKKMNLKINGEPIYNLGYID